MKIQRIAVGAFVGVTAALALSAPAYAEGPQPGQSCAEHNSTVTSGSYRLKCLPDSHNSPQWLWQIVGDAPTATPTTAPPVKPTKTAPTVTQACAADIDVNKSKIDGGITYTCMNVNGKYTWKKAGTNVDQSCAADVDINKSKIKDGVTYTCTNTNGSYGWSKARTNVTQTCTADVDINKSRIDGGINYVCVNLNESSGKPAKYGWKKATGNVTQTCNVDIDLTKTTIVGDVNVTCVNANVNGKPTKVWAPPAGKSCPSKQIGGVNCIENPKPVLREICKVPGETYVLGGKVLVCGLPKAVVIKPGASAPDNCWIPEEEADTTAITLQSNGSSLPVTGSSTLVMAGAGLGLLTVGAGAFVLNRRRKVRFTA